MGEVWLAEHETIKSQVAIKLVLAAPDDEEAASRFLREAKATARIRHPGVVTVSDFGPRKAGGAYLVMELLDGESLADRLERGPLPSDLAIDLGVQIAEALAAAHQTGVVHRDLKPANVFLVRDAATREGVRVKLVDFGVAKATGKVTDELGVTVTGALVGTPVYMAPEQCTTRRGPVDHRADLYALGVVLYEILTGKPPFRGPTLGDLIDQHVNETPVSPRVSVPSIPAKLDVLIMTLLAKDRADRPASANEVARVLHDLRGTKPTQETLDETMGSGSSRPIAKDPSMDETLASVDRPKTSVAQPASNAEAAPPKAAVTNIDPRPVPKALIWGLVGGFVLFGVILVVIVMGRDKGDAPPAPPVDPATACETGDARVCLSLVEKELLLEKPDLSRVVSWTRTGCDRGDLKACARLAWMYEWGVGVVPDQSRAFTLAKESCEKGNGDACDIAGDVAPITVDRTKVAYGFYVRGCDQGSSWACQGAGRMTKFGQGTHPDPARGQQLFERSYKLATAGCMANDAWECRVVGVALLRGDGAAKDSTAGYAKLQRACDLGSPEACGEVGEQLALGAAGVHKDPVQARKYLELGCNRGSGVACLTLGIAYAYGLVGPVDIPKGFELAKYACENRSPRLCSVLGNFYRQGFGTPKDLALAGDYYKRACDAFDADGCAQLATMEPDDAKKEALLERACTLGNGSFGCKLLADRERKKGNDARAAELFAIACSTSDSQVGCKELASAYIEGRGVPQDVARGREILETGCAAQAQVSCNALGERLRDGNGFTVDPVRALQAFDQACELGWGAACISGAEMREDKKYGITPDPKKAAELRKRGCELEPARCKPAQPSESKSESPPQ